MTAKQFELEVLYNNKYVIAEFDKDNYYLDDENSAKSLECRLNELFDENKRLKQFIQELTTKSTGRIDLANGYSYKVNAILTDFKR